MLVLRVGEVPEGGPDQPHREGGDWVLAKTLVDHAVHDPSKLVINTGKGPFQKLNDMRATERGMAVMGTVSTIGPLTGDVETVPSTGGGLVTQLGGRDTRVHRPRDEGARKSRLKKVANRANGGLNEHKQVAQGARVKHISRSVADRVKMCKTKT